MFLKDKMFGFGAYKRKQMWIVKNSNKIFIYKWLITIMKKKKKMDVIIIKRFIT